MTIKIKKNINKILTWRDDILPGTLKVIKYETANFQLKSEGWKGSNRTSILKDSRREQGKWTGKSDLTSGKL